MDVQEVQRQVARIREMADDNESAHAKEDSLWANVLEAIAGGISDSDGLASAALKTKEITFSRWYS